MAGTFLPQRAIREDAPGRAMFCMVPHGVGIVGYAEHDASRRTLPRRSLGQERTCRAGYEVVKVGAGVTQV